MHFNVEHIIYNIYSVRLSQDCHRNEFPNLETTIQQKLTKPLEEYSRIRNVEQGSHSTANCNKTAIAWK